MTNEKGRVAALPEVVDSIGGAVGGRPTGLRIAKGRNFDLNWIDESPQRAIAPRRNPRGSVVIDWQILHRIVKPANAGID